MNEINKIKRTTPRILSGFMELLPAQQIEFNKFLNIIQETYESFGFVPQETPLVESAEILLSKSGGETEKQIYAFKKGDDDLALRFDLTIPLARYVAMYYSDLAFPFRRYQIGKVYRGERAQKGRYREFYQADIDIVGDGELSLVNDAEIPSVINSLFTKLNIGEFSIRINNRKILNGFVKELGLEDKQTEILRIVDKLDKIGEGPVVTGMVELGVSELSAYKLIEFIGIKGTNEEILKRLVDLKVVNDEYQQGVRELYEVVKMAYLFGVPEKNLQVDLTIARGLDYYTGTVYETKMLNEAIQGSVCSGGRYDNLAETFCNKKLPGVGMSIGLTRLFSQMLSTGLIESKVMTPAKVLVVPMEDAQMDFALEVATGLRRARINTEIYTEEDKFKKKLGYANKVGVEFVAILGPDEETQGKVSLKNMLSGEQEKLSLEDLINRLS